MRVKCIGGECDGTIIEIDNKFKRVGDCVKVNRVIAVETALNWSRDPYKMSEYVTVPIVFYILDRLRYYHEKEEYTDIWFLRPERYTAFDAIQFQFMK